MSKSRTKVVKDNSERWLLTYADLMNLLLILFIVLYAMSKVDMERYEQVAASLRSAFGDSSPQSYIHIPGGGNSLLPLDHNAPSPVIPLTTEQQQMEAITEEVAGLINKENLKGDIDVSVEERGIVISITAELLFKSGSAVIEPGSRKTIEELGKVLLAVPGRHIKVEGHTDTDPIATSKFPDNWELSSARATTVLRLLVDKSGIDPKVISAVGYGEFRPKYPNTTEANKAANRRVNIVIVKSAYSKAEGETTKPAQDEAE